MAKEITEPITNKYAEMVAGIRECTLHEDYTAVKTGLLNLYSIMRI